MRFLTKIVLEKRLGLSPELRSFDAQNQCFLELDSGSPQPVNPAPQPAAGTAIPGLVWVGVDLPEPLFPGFPGGGNSASREGLPSRN